MMRTTTITGGTINPAATLKRISNNACNHAQRRVRIGPPSSCSSNSSSSSSFVAASSTENIVMNKSVSIIVPNYYSSLYACRNASSPSIISLPPRRYILYNFNHPTVLCNDNFSRHLSTEAAANDEPQHSASPLNRRNDNARGQRSLQQERYLTKLTQKTNSIINTPIGKMLPPMLTNALNLLNQWSSLKTQLGAYNAEQLLERLVSEARDGNNPYVFLSPSLYNIVIDSWAKCGSVDGGTIAESLVARMEERYHHSRKGDEKGEESEAKEKAYPKPDVITYNSLLHAWSKSQHPEALSKVRYILSRMEESSQTTTDGVIDEADGSNALPKPNTMTYNIVIDAYANRKNIYGSAQEAEDLLLKMSQLSMDHNTTTSTTTLTDVHPDTTSFNTVLKAWKNSADGGTTIESAKRAEEILRLMIRLYDGGHANLRPDVISFATVISAYGMTPTASSINRENSDDYEKVVREGVERARSVLQLLKETDLAKQEGNVLQCYNVYMDVIAKSGLDDAGELAKSAFEEMVHAYENGEIPDGPNVITYSNLIGAFADSKERVLAEKGIILLEKMISGVTRASEDASEGESASEIGVARVLPDTICFNKVLHMCSRFRLESKAEELFSIMQDLAELKQLDALPDVATYHIMINMFSRSKRKDSAIKALDALTQMEKAYENGLIPSIDSFPFNIVINKLSKTKNVAFGGKSLAREAYKVLTRMENHYQSSGNDFAQPDAITYNIVISSLAKEGGKHSAEMVMDLLGRMKEISSVNNSSQQAGNHAARPDTITYTNAIKAWAKSGQPDSSTHIMALFNEMDQLESEGSDIVHLDQIVFETVLTGLSLSRNKGDAKLAGEVLGRMISMYKNGNEFVKPTASCYNLALKAHCANQKHRSASVFDAHRMLFKMVRRYKDDGMLPDRIGFNTVISTFAKLRNRNALEKAEEVLNLMQTLHERGVPDVSPDKFTYSAMLTNFSNNSNSGWNHKNTDDSTASRAQEIFDKIDPELLDKAIYNSLLLVWAKSNKQDKFQRAHQILQNMVKQGQADRISYNTVLNSCAFTRGGDDANLKAALEVAFNVFEELKSSPFIVPDEISFATLMKACTNLSRNEEERCKLLKNVFEDCCNHGLVGNMVLKELKFALSDVSCDEYLRHSSNGKLKDEWTCNIKQRK